MAHVQRDPISEAYRSICGPVMRCKRDQARDSGGRISKAITWPLAMLAGILVYALLICFFLMFAASPVAAETGREMTKRFEGFRSEVYLCPAGARSVGYGFNLDDPDISQWVPEDVRSGTRPMSRVEADRVFEILYSRAMMAAQRFAGDQFVRMSDLQKNILIDMAYNLGEGRLNKFARMRRAILSGDFFAAADEMQDSLWYQQVRSRGQHHVQHFAEGI